MVIVYFALFLDAFPRKFNSSYQLFNDLRVSVNDMYERMSGYTYFGIIDFDEFLIPAGKKTIKEMLVSKAIVLAQTHAILVYCVVYDRTMTFFRCVIHVHKKKVWNKCFIVSFSGIVLIQDRIQKYANTVTKYQYVNKYHK